MGACRPRSCSPPPWVLRGVERAVEAVERALEAHGRPVYVRKQIVHNAHVVRDLEAKGAVFVEEETEVPEGAVVVLSAHGVAPQVYANAERRGSRSWTRLAHSSRRCILEARRFADHGRTIVLIGHAGHEEVVGTTGQAPTGTILVQNIDEGALGPGARSREPVVLSRRPRCRSTRPTRSSRRSANGSLDPGTAARGHLLRDPEPPGRDQEVARRSDVVLVIGSDNSSNPTASPRSPAISAPRHTWSTTRPRSTRLASRAPRRSA